MFFTTCNTTLTSLVTSKTTVFIVGLFLVTSCTTDSEKTYKLNTSANPIEGGIIKPSDGEFYEGEEIQVEAIPNDGWQFVRWELDISSTQNPITLTMNKNYSVVGVFKSGFYLHDNGITIMCPDTSPGDKGFVDGIEYESVDRQSLLSKRDVGADLTRLCTSLVTSMFNLFEGKDFNQPIGNWDVSNVEVV